MFLELDSETIALQIPITPLDTLWLEPDIQDSQNYRCFVTEFGESGPVLEKPVFIGNVELTGPRGTKARAFGMSARATTSGNGSSIRIKIVS
jgi:hypothetical protein